MPDQPSYIELFRGLLVKKAFGKSLTATEESQLAAWAEKSDENQKFLNQILNYHKLGDQMNVIDKIDVEKMWGSIKLFTEVRHLNEGEIVQASAVPTAGIRSADHPPVYPSPAHRVHFLKTAAFRYAAAIFFIIAAGAYLWFQNKQEQKLASTHKQMAADIKPGKEGAVLTLANGTQVVLDSLENGVVATQNGTDVVLKDGLLTYQARDNSAPELSYNTITTPMGRQFQLALPDGSRVWLNAASSIKYPTVFSGADRMVEINGEAYFEVEKNTSMPFKVKINDAAAIEVLGTSFNINSYENEEAVKTTLIQGSVRVNAYKHLQTLKPGQQAFISRNEKIKIVDSMDINQVTAWKNGYFDFNNADLQIMMRQLERWYDIVVTYKGKIPDMVFEGQMDRNVQLSDVILFLKAFGIKATLQGRTLVVFGT